MSLVVMVCGHHGCGHHGHCLWPSWFVAITVEPQFNKDTVKLRMKTLNIVNNNRESVLSTMTACRRDSKSSMERDCEDCFVDSSVS